MPCMTYLDDHDVDRYTASVESGADADLVELLGLINARPGERWCLRKTTCPRPTWFGLRARAEEAYCLYAHHNYTEWQCINFAGSDGVRFNISRREMLNFLLGYRMGLEQGGRT